MPAFIISNDKSFIGNVLDIPPLRKKLDNIGGKVTEKEIIIMAEELLEEYQFKYDNDREFWNEFKKNNRDEYTATYGQRSSLKRLINIYYERIGCRDLPFNILSSNRKFIGNVITTPPLRSILDTRNGDITEEEIIALAEDLFTIYEDRYVNNRELWDSIKLNDFETHRATQASRIKLRHLIKDYHKRMENGDEIAASSHLW